MVAGLAHLAAEERMLLGRPEEHRTDALAHPPLCDHHPCEASGLLEILGGAGREVVVDETFCGAAPEEDGKFGVDLALAVVEPILLGKELRDPERTAARDDRDLV